MLNNQGRKIIKENVKGNIRNFDNYKNMSSGDGPGFDQKWDEIMKIDSSLAEIGPDDMLYGSAISMRGLWRIQIGTKKQAREAVDLYDQVLTRHRTRENYYHRVRAAAAAGETEMTWVGLNHFTDRANIGPPYVVRELLSIVRDLGQPPPLHAEVPGRLNQAARAAGRGRAQL